MLGRARSGCAIPNTQVFLLSSIATYTVSRASAAASVVVMVAAPRMCEDGDRRSARSAALIGSFCHESSANEPSGTARFSRARARGAAGVAAMPVAGGIARFGLPPAGRDQRGGLHDH